MWHIEGPFWGWALSSIVIGLGFTFFSGATEAWLVDALKATGYKGDLESVFAKGQIVSGASMLTGSVLGGVIAQATNLSVPYMVRAGMLVLTFGVAYKFMKDLGFTPETDKSYRQEVKELLGASIDHGLKNPPVRWMMISSFFLMGVSVYVFYAFQPFLLELYGDDEAFGIAGLVAALAAAAQIVGGFTVRYVTKIFKRRTDVLILSLILGTTCLLLIGTVSNFWIVVPLLAGWSLSFAVAMPVRQAFVNAEIPSKQRATVLSFDSLMGSSGGVISQPALGRSADLYGYAPSYLMCAAVQSLALPCMWAARKTDAAGDFETSSEE